MQAGGQRGEQVGKGGNVRASQPKSAVAEKVGFALAVRQPRPQTNFSFLRQMTAPILMKLITIHVCILTRVANSRLLPLSEKDVLSLRAVGWESGGVIIP